MAPLDYLAAHSRKPLRKTESWGAIPQSATLTAPFTQRGLCAVRQCVPFPLAAQVRQWGPRGSPASAGSSDGRYAPKPPLCKGRWLGFRGPGEAQRQRVHWGEEEQRNERAFALKAKREIWSLRRRGHNMPQNGQITFQTFPGKWGKIATAGRGSPRGEAER